MKKRASGESHYLSCVCANYSLTFCVLRTPKRDIIFNLMKVLTIWKKKKKICFPFP